jgi:hypothetical protein
VAAFLFLRSVACVLMWCASWHVTHVIQLSTTVMQL